MYLIPPYGNIDRVLKLYKLKNASVKLPYINPQDLSKFGLAVGFTVEEFENRC